MSLDSLKGIKTLRYSDIFLAMYFDDGMSCLHRNHSHVLVYMYSGELEIKEREKITRLHKGDCAFIRKDFSVQLTKQGYKGQQFKAIFLMFTAQFLRDFYSKLDKRLLPKDAHRSRVSLCKLPSSRPDIVSLFESMTPYFNSGVQPTDDLYNPQIQFFAKSETKRPKIELSYKTKRSENRKRTTPKMQPEKVAFLVSTNRLKQALK